MVMAIVDDMTPDPSPNGEIFTMKEALELATKMNCLFLTEPSTLRGQRSDFERQYFSSFLSSSSPGKMLIIVDRPSEINEYYKAITSKMNFDISLHKILTLDGLLNLDAVLSDWKKVSSSSMEESPMIIITSSNTILGVLAHGFAKLTDFSVVYVSRMPSANNGHPVNKILLLHYDPTTMGQLVRILGWDIVDNNLDICKAEAKTKAPNLVFAMSEWTQRMRHYRNNLKCHIVNLVPTLSSCMSKSDSSSLISFQVISNHPHKLDMPKDCVLLTQNQDGDGLRDIQLSQQKTTPLISSSQALHIHVNNGLDHESLLQTALQIRQLTNSNSQMITVSGTPEALGALKAFLYHLDHHDNEGLLLRIKDTGAVIHPLIAVDLLLRFCAYLPKVNGEGKPLTSLKVITVPIREFDENGDLVCHLNLFTLTDDKSVVKSIYDVFITQITMPQRLHTWFPKPILGKPSGSRHGAQSSACYEACVQLHRMGLMTPHLMAINELRQEDIGGEVEEESLDSVSAPEEAETETDDLDQLTNGPIIQGDVEENNTTMVTNETLNEVIPDEFIATTPLEPSSFKLYAITYDCTLKDTSTLPLWSRILLSSEESFLDTQSASGRCFGLLLPASLPCSLMPISVPLGSEHALTVQLTYVTMALEQSQLEVIMSIQTLLFGLLSVRPLSTISEEQILQEEKANNLSNVIDLLKHTTTYFIVPLAKGVVKSLKDEEQFVQFMIEAFKQFLDPDLNTITCKEGDWKIDWDLVNALRKESQYSLDLVSVYERLVEASKNLSINRTSRKEKKVFDNKKEEGEEKKDSLEQAFVHFALTQCVLMTPYNEMHYRFRKIYPFLTPDSPFSCKGNPEVKTYAQYVLTKYFPPGAQLPVIDNNDPFPGMLGVGRIENFADISQWVLLNGDDSEDIFSIVSNEDHHRVKKRRKETDSQDSKSALIPCLVRISPLPYWLLRTILVVPRVAFELERQLAAQQFYERILQIPMPGHHFKLAVESLTATTAGLPYSYERLEVLGDCFLKFACSLDLMASEQRWGEGKLSQRRQGKICNVNLYRTGRSLGIHRYCALTPFSSKLWCPPGIEFLLPPLEQQQQQQNDSDEWKRNAWMQSKRLRRVLFDPTLRWRLLKGLQAHNGVRDDPWTLLPGGKLVPPSNNASNTNPNINDGGSGLSRYGMNIPAKFIADLLESVMGAVFEAHGYHMTCQLLVNLKLCSPTLLTVSSMGKLRLLGNLAGDPRDKLPLVKVQNQSNGSKKREDKVDWGKLPGRKPSNFNNENVKETGGGGDEVVIKVSAISAEPGEINKEGLQAVERTLNYKFEEPLLLYRALTHVSVDSVHCNERLEWLGDAVLDWLVTLYFYRHPLRTTATPSELTEARKCSVNNVSLSEIAVKLELFRYLRLGAKAASSFTPDIDKFTASVQEKYREYSDSMKERNSNSNTNFLSDPNIYWELAQQDPLPPKVLGDLVESVIGALFIDVHQDIDRANELIMPWLRPFLERHVDRLSVRTNPISLCLESWAKLGIGRMDLVFEHSLIDDADDHYLSNKDVTEIGNSKIGNISESMNNANAAQEGKLRPNNSQHVVIAKVMSKSTRSWTMVGRGQASTRILAKQLAASDAADYLRRHPQQVQQILNNNGNNNNGGDGRGDKSDRNDDNARYKNN